MEKKSLYKYITYVLVLAILVTLMVPASAFANVALTGNIGISVDGRNISFDVTPFVDAQNRTMVPIRFISDELGAQVNWTPAEQRVTIRYQGQEIELWIGRQDAGVNGNTVTMDTQATLVDGRAMVPVRFVGESFGADVSWQPTNRMVVITTTGANVSQPGDNSPPQGEGESSGLSDDGRQVVIVTGSVVNLRRGPGTSYDILGTTRNGDMLEALSESNGWHYVRTANGTQGWISGQHAFVRTSLVGKLIVIDPGHGVIRDTGLTDPGAVGPTGLTERDVVMDISNKLAGILEEKGAEVILTRNGSSTNLTLHGRAQLANSLDADLFVSVHANASPNRDIAGTSTFFYAPEDNPRLGPQRFQRTRLAQLVQQSMVEHGGRRDIGIEQRPFVVIRETNMPSILVEAAFISNPTEEQLLADPEFRARIAKGIAEGIERYFN